MENKNNFSTNLTFAVVTHADVNDIAKIKEFLQDLENTRIVYQKADSGKLRIEPEEDNPAEP